MFSIPLVKQDILENLRLWLLATGAMILWLLFLLWNYEPQAELFSVLPQSVRQAFGVELRAVPVTDFLGGYFYGSVALLLPLVYSVPAAARIVAGRLENGMMAYLLSTPNTREKIIFSQIYYLGISLFVMFFTVFAAGCAVGAFWGEKLSVAVFALMNLGAFCLHFFLAGICFFVSCICNDRRISWMIGSGISILFYLIRVLANLGGVFDYLKFLTFFSLFSPRVLSEGSVMFAWEYPLLILAGLLCYWFGSRLFRKRDLPI